jgi:uncharacterized protein
VARWARTTVVDAATLGLLDRGAEPNWIPPWEDLSPLDAAQRRGAEELVAWFRDRGASSAAELHAT